MPKDTALDESELLDLSDQMDAAAKTAGLIGSDGAPTATTETTKSPEGEQLEGEELEGGQEGTEGQEGGEKPEGEGAEGEKHEGEEGGEKPAGEKPAAEAPKPTEQKPAVTPEAVKPATEKPADQGERDKDLVVSLNPNTHPKTRQVIDGYKAKVVEARNETDTLKKQVAELTEKVKVGGMDEDTKNELEALRREVRQVAVERDPGLKIKFDDRISKNSERVLDIIQQFGGFGSNPKAGMSDKDAATLKAAQIEYRKAFQADGVNIASVQAYLEELSKVASAQKNNNSKSIFLNAKAEIEELLRENGILTRNRSEEVERIKGDLEGYTKKQQEEAAAANSNFNKAFGSAYTEELKRFQSEFSLFAPPPPAADSDTPAVKAQKEKALETYNAVVKDVQEKGMQLLNDARTGDPKSASKYFASAMSGVAYRYHVVPALQKQVTELTEKLAKAEGLVSRARKVGETTKVISKAQKTTKQAEQSADPDDLEAQMDAAARAAGLLK